MKIHMMKKIYTKVEIIIYENKISYFILRMNLTFGLWFLLTYVTNECKNYTIYSIRKQNFQIRYVITWRQEEKYKIDRASLGSILKACNDIPLTVNVNYN